MQEPNPDIILKIHEISQHVNERTYQYKSWEHQLDMLFNDIEAGKFGEDAKTGSWYLWIKGIKDANPKPDNLEKLKEELDALMASDPQASGEVD